MKYKSIVLLSGGLDSAVTLALAVAKKKKPLALTFRYGQTAEEKEVAASRRLAAFYRVPIKIIDINFLKEFSNSALLKKNGNKSNPLKVWVANRNGLFLNIAGVIAESLKIPVIYCGFNREEAINFPDNSKKFIKIANKFFKLSTKTGVQVKSFLMNLDKKDILKIAFELKIPLNYLWVCYENGLKFCGQCLSCRLFKKALKKAKIKINKKKFYESQIYK